MKELDKRFRQVVALGDLSLQVPTGASYFLLGPNGSGKTTLVRLLAGVLRPTHGDVRVLGEDPYRHPEHLARRVGIAYEDHHLPGWASARDYLRFAARSRGFDGDIVDETAEAFELTTYWLREMGTYSAGMRKRVMLAQAWLGDPDLLLLDEPFSNLDPQGRWFLARQLRDRASTGRTTIVATHLAETLAPPTHLGFLVNGTLEAAGPIGDLADRYAARSVPFAVPDPGEGVRILLKKGIAAVTALGDRIVVKGDSEAVGMATAALQEAGIATEPGEESCDIWAIYRSVLGGRAPEETGASSIDRQE
ncbi:MAG: ABC transporter ATP-binding protein [Thermoplasmata archaeon]